MTWLDYERKRNPCPVLWELPERFTGTTLASLPVGPLKTAAEQYVAEFLTLGADGKAPVFLGRAGTGKTMTAVAITAQVSHTHRVAVQFVNVPELLMQVELNRFSDTTRLQVASLETIPFLVLDDFATVKTDSFGHQILQALCAGRFNAKRPTLWTGNVHLANHKELPQFTALYGPLMARRIFQTGEGLVVFTG